MGVSRPARQQCQVLFEASALFVELLSGQTLVREWSRPLGVGNGLGTTVHCQDFGAICIGYATLKTVRRGNNRKGSASEQRRHLRQQVRLGIY